MQYYQILGIGKKATQAEVKQAYRQMALKHHPDKNQDKQKAKIKFTQITQAYTVLNDPQKRQFYDQYGKVDFDPTQFGDFQSFMSDFGMFQQFLDEFLMFDTMNELGKILGKTKKSKKQTRARRAKAAKGGITSNPFKMDDDQGLSFQDMIEQALGQQLFPKSKKQKKEEEIQSEDDGDLTEQQMKLLQFGNQNIEKKKAKKKNILICKLDNETVKQDQILMHFSQKHMKQFHEWSIKK